MLAHFKPFSSEFPLIERNKTVQSTFNDFSFSEKSRLIMKNWEAIYECEDERDADRLRKRAALAKESQALTHSMAFEDDDDLIAVSSEQMTAKKDFEVNSVLLRLLESNWLKKVEEYSVPIQTEKVKTLEIPDLTKSLLQTWKNEMKSQEEVILTRRRNAQDTSNQIGTQEILETEIGTNAIPTLDTPTSVKETETMTDKDVPLETREELLNRIIQEETLNRKQTIAFCIIANSFFKLMDDRKNGINSTIDSKYKKYLSLLLTGPGGTGKTHVVKAIQRVMEAYGRANNIRFLAPSGAAAALIDGMTIHKGLFIKVRKKGKGNRVPGESEDYGIIMSVSDKRKIREEFKDVDIVMIDEVSLSQEILAEIDHALRYAKGNNLFFGGIIIIFAGDFYQYPPVGGTPLYTPVRYAKKNEDITDQLFAKRLGHMVWKSVDEVIFLEEQQRMRGDPEYGDAVLRLRKCKCVMEDVYLFNSCVINQQTIQMVLI